MITCPYCGTGYLSFQPNCSNCGGPLSVQTIEQTPGADAVEPPWAPPAPRPISDRYIWRLLMTDGWMIAAFVFGLLGIIFSLIGGVLIIAIITAIIGIIFLPLGLGFLAAGGGLFAWRYQIANKVVRVLRDGEQTEGRITSVQENLSVNINGRHPWIIRYKYQLREQTYGGDVQTLNPPGQQLQAGKLARILYLPANPEASSIYPHP